MSESATLWELVRDLDRDSLHRSAQDFSAEFRDVHNVLWNPHATAYEREDALSGWLQRHQPCLFGRIAAKQGQLHICLLTDDEIRDGDECVRRKLAEALLEWKRRSLDPSGQNTNPAPGFLLVLASPRIALAMPGRRIAAVAERVLELWGCASAVHPAGGKIYSESLYLRDRTRNAYLKYTFSIDWFAAQGDGRWWIDHRMPGGMAFTANSVGHMQRVLEMESGQAMYPTWALDRAMHTISKAQYGPSGPANRLLPLDAAGRPQHHEVAYPGPTGSPPSKLLRDKDWTEYRGWYHTDLAVRAEFLREDIVAPEDVARRDYKQDFTYLYRESTRDHLEFVTGAQVSEEEVHGAIGPPASWPTVTTRGSRAERSDGAEDRPIKASSDESSLGTEFRESLARCRTWFLSDDELRELRGF